MSAPDRFPLELALPFVPTLCYLAAAIMAACALCLWPTHLGAALLVSSLGVSELTAPLARKLEVASKWGFELEWALSSTIAAGTAWCCLGARAPVALVLLGSWEALARYMDWRVSGRSAVTLAALVGHFGAGP